MLSRVRVADLIRAHHFCRVLDDLKDDDDPLQFLRRRDSGLLESNVYSEFVTQMDAPGAVAMLQNPCARSTRRTTAANCGRRASIWRGARASR